MESPIAAMLRGSGGAAAAVGAAARAAPSAANASAPRRPIRPQVAMPRSSGRIGGPRRYAAAGGGATALDVTPRATSARRRGEHLAEPGQHVLLALAHPLRVEAQEPALLGGVRSALGG